MGILDFLTGEFIDVIHWTDDTRDTMVWRFEREGHEIKYGAKLTVREGQAAVFVHEGQLADVFTPGLYMLETNNMPILTTLQHWDHGFKSPFKSRDLLRQHHPLHRPEVGHEEPDHVPRPRVRPGAHPRLRHLHGAGDRSGQVPDRDRRHRRRIHHGRDHASRSATSSCRRSAGSSRGSGIPVLDMAANTDGARQAGGGRAVARCWRTTGWRCRSSTSRTSRCRRRSKRRSTSAPRWGSSAIWTSTCSSTPPRRWAPRTAAMATLDGRRHGRRAWRHGHGRQARWRRRVPGARPRAAAARRRSPHRRRRRRSNRSGTSPRTARPRARSAARRWARWPAAGELTRESLVWTAGPGRLEDRPDDVAELAQLFTILPPPPPPAG